MKRSLKLDNKLPPIGNRPVIQKLLFFFSALPPTSRERWNSAINRGFRAQLRTSDAFAKATEGARLAAALTQLLEEVWEPGCCTTSKDNPISGIKGKI